MTFIVHLNELILDMLIILSYYFEVMYLPIDKLKIGQLLKTHK